jgi:gliding motility-associated-like protein
MKHLLLIFLFPLFVYSQFCPALGPDQILPCGIGTTTLTADLSQCGPGGANPNQTTNYNCVNIPYVNQTNTGTQLFMGDDTQQGPFQIGFNFCYYGQTYTQFWVGSNGWISFSPGQPTTFTSTPIPNAGFNIPKNCIMGPWQDWHPGIGGQIRYQVQGTSPCRKLVVSWVNMPMFGCISTLGTFHIVIYESSNHIENHIQSKPFCTWANGTAVQGIHNQTGTAAITVVGRNSTQWVANNDAYRWVPSGPTVNPVLTWYQVGNPTPIGTGPTINVTPPAAGASYTCQFVYPICNAGWGTCNQQQGGFGPDTVFVQPGPPNLPPPIINFANPICNGNCDGLISVTPVGGNGVTTISWNGLLPNNFINLGLCAGNYPFTITDSQGCTVSSNVTLIDPPQVVITSINGSDTVCYNSTSNIFSVSSVFPNLSYNWVSTIGSITTGQGSSQINLDVTGVNSGVYNNALSVYGVDQTGCVSDIQTFDVVNFNLLPLVTQIGPFCEYDGCITLTATPPNGTFSGNNVWLNEYCPNNGFIGVDNVNYQVTQSGCWFDTTINVDVFPRPTIIPVIDGRSGVNYEYHELCDGDSIQDIYEGQSPFAGYNEWYVFGDTIQGSTINLTWNQEGLFSFDVVRWSNGCVSFPETITVALSLCPQEIIYIPNTFTPDGNEHNQYFLPVITSGVDLFNYKMTIYNRWGEVIWESLDPKEGWDGTYNNILCPDGSYTWVLEFKVIDTDEKKEYHGNLTIIR